MKRNQWLLSFYGDDFTGSTDVMETLALHGIPTALFLEPPNQAQVEAFTFKHGLGGKQLRAFGVAGIARSLTPEQMKPELHKIFQSLASIPVDFFHYKICSTLDSSVEIGNIGIAAELAHQYFPSSYIPLVVGAPFLNRFVVFGHLFARLDGKNYRLDRHPVMAKHPVTPMDESDIEVHLSRQTQRTFTHIDVFDLNSGDTLEKAFREKEPTDGGFLLFDTLSNNHLRSVGRILYEGWHANHTQLLVGSSGISYGLATHLHPDSIVKPYRKSVDQILVISGSCSPVTAKQIQTFIQEGARPVAIDVRALLKEPETEQTRVIEEALASLTNGHSSVIYTALAAADILVDPERGPSDISLSLGQIAKVILAKKPNLRTVIVGGDTSGKVARQLDIYALETLCPIAPGAPLCIAHSKNAYFDGLEIALKGGQNGKANYFAKICNPEK